jgi:hypothetical protein
MANPHPLARLLLAVLASVWFFPVSCTTALVAGTPLLAKLDERDAAKGDAIHRSIAVTAMPPTGDDRAFDYLLLGNVESYRERHPQASFLMPAKEGSIHVQTSIRVSYKVVAERPGEQTIDTHYRDGDREAWGRYRATKDGVTGISSRAFDSFYLFSAVPYAFGFALLFIVGGRIAKRRMQRLP